MNQPFLTLAVRRKRDVLAARHYARQIARLLGFEPLDSIVFAAAVFELAWQAFHCKAHPLLDFSLEERLVVVSGGRGFQLRKALPRQTQALAAEDLPWAMRELTRLGRIDLFEESHRQNQELLSVAHDLVQLKPPAEPAASGTNEQPSSAA